MHKNQKATLLGTLLLPPMCPSCPPLTPAPPKVTVTATARIARGPGLVTGPGTREEEEEEEEEVEEARTI